MQRPGLRYRLGVPFGSSSSPHDASASLQRSSWLALQRVTLKLCKRTGQFGSVNLCSQQAQLELDKYNDQSRSVSSVSKSRGGFECYECERSVGSGRVGFPVSVLNLSNQVRYFEYERSVGYGQVGFPVSVLKVSNQAQCSEYERSVGSVQVGFPVSVLKLSNQIHWSVILAFWPVSLVLSNRPVRVATSGGSKLRL